jgi:nicotinate-nucleotide pyrophosphorylase (carboxylating)
MNPHGELEALVGAALAEDLGAGDWTTRCTVPAEAPARARIVAKSPGVLAGTEVATAVFRRLDPGCEVVPAAEGTRLAAGDIALRIAGSARAILSGERVALNFLQHLSGIATRTAQFVDAIAGTGAVISDTRKTTPLLRRLEKQAVRSGGGRNHRAALDAMLLVKENHIAAAGGLRPALAAALREGAARGLEVEIEVRTMDEYRAALELQPDWILLDHWTPAAVREAVALRGSRLRPRLEASGNLHLASVRDYALAGAEVLSIGELTHSAPVLDLSLLVDAP